MSITSPEKPKTSAPKNQERSKPKTRETRETRERGRNWTMLQIFYKAKQIAKQQNEPFKPTDSFKENISKGLEMVEKMCNITDSEKYPDTIPNMFNFVDRNGDMFLSDTISLEQFIEAQAAMIVKSLSNLNTVETKETTKSDEKVVENTETEEATKSPIISAQPEEIAPTANSIEIPTSESPKIVEQKTTTEYSTNEQQASKPKKVIFTSRQKEAQKSDIDFFQNLISQNLTSSHSSPPAISSNIIETVGLETVGEQDENDDDQLDMQLQLRGMKSALKNNFENINESLSDLDDKKITLTNEIKEEIYQTIGEAISTIAMVSSMDGAYRESDLEYFNSMLAYLQNKKDMMNDEEFLDIVKELCDTYKSLTK